MSSKGLLRVIALLVWAAPLVAQTPASQPTPTQSPAQAAHAAPSPQQPPSPAAGAAQASSATTTLVFGSEAGLVLHAIKPDKAAAFEAVLAKLRDALQKSQDPVRQEQGASLKIMKAAEPGPAGAVLYVFIVDPVVKGADYTMSRLLAEAYPDEVDALWTTLREAYAAGMNKVSLDPVK